MEIMGALNHAAGPALLKLASRVSPLLFLPISHLNPLKWKLSIQIISSVSFQINTIFYYIEEKISSTCHPTQEKNEIFDIGCATATRTNNKWLFKSSSLSVLKYIKAHIFLG